jgi:hypothetical protein
MWEHCTFDSKIFRCGEVYYSNSIIITNFVQTFIPNRWFENAYRILVGNAEGKRPLGRPRRRWVDNIKMNLRERGWDGMD